MFPVVVWGVALGVCWAENMKLVLHQLDSKPAGAFTDVTYFCFRLVDQEVRTKVGPVTMTR